MGNVNYNLDLEFSIIGTLLTAYKDTIKYFDKIQEEFFYNNMNREMLTKAKQCYMNRTEFTEYMAIEHLKNAGYTDKTATNYILKCSENVITIYTLKNDLKLLEELYRKRELENILKLGLESKEDFDTNTEKLLQDLYNLRRSSKDSKKKMKNMLTATNEYLDFISYEDSNGGRVDTGYPLIDSMLKGMFAGQLIGLAARPGCGKSAFSTNIAINVAKKGKKVAIFSQEMEAYEIVERMTANQSLIPMDTLIEKLKIENKDGKIQKTTKEVEDVYFNKVVSKLSDLSKLPIHIADITRLTATEIRTNCQQIKDLNLIIIDYLQLMMPTKKEQNRNLEIAQITRELKILASELQCPILLLSQLNRTKEETDKPSLNDYRDSGAIEQDLVKSLMMWKIDVDEDLVGITINKNRRGSTGDVKVKFTGKYMMYTEIGIHKEEKKPKKKKDWSDL